MGRIHLIAMIVKVLRIPLHIFGFLQLRKERHVYQQNPNWYRFIPIGIITLLLVVRKCFYKLTYPEIILLSPYYFKDLESWNDNIQSVSFFVIMIWSLKKKKLLWQLVNEAQIHTIKLRFLLGKPLTFKCSKSVMRYGLILMLLLGSFVVKSLYLDYPYGEMKENLITISHKIRLRKIVSFTEYLMGLPRLMFVTVMSTHILYHVLTSGWLQTLGESRLHRNPRLFQFYLSCLICFQSRANLMAGHYFRMSYILLLYTLGYHFSKLLEYCRFEGKDVVQQFKSHDDLEDEAEWSGQDSDDSSKFLIESLSVLSWYLAMWMLLLAAAQCHQEEYLRLTRQTIWEIKFDGNDRETKKFVDGNSWQGQPFKKLDVIDVMFLSGFSIWDRQPISVYFLTEKFRKKSSSGVDLDSVAGHFRLLLNITIFAGMAYFAQQMELRHLHEYSKQQG
ncbi:hypothetical protein KR018_006849 [Drosophila ironensis]|nr:hypothetical protein KR018_006849 [Drosophila ironensis]